MKKLQTNITVNVLLTGLAVLLASSPVKGENNSKVESELGLQAMGRLLSWFPKTVSSFDKFTTAEEKKQFIRRLKKLERSLLALQHRKIELNALLEDGTSMKREDLIEEVTRYYQDLVPWLRTTQSQIEDISALLESSDAKEGREVSRLLIDVVNVRAFQRVAIQDELERGVTNLDRIKSNNLAGMGIMSKTREVIGNLIAKLQSPDASNKPQ